jgi:hypothetical protein
MHHVRYHAQARESAGEQVKAAEASVFELRTPGQSAA